MIDTGWHPLIQNSASRLLHRHIYGVGTPSSLQIKWFPLTKLPSLYHSIFVLFLYMYGQLNYWWSPGVCLRQPARRKIWLGSRVSLGLLLLIEVKSLHLLHKFLLFPLGHSKSAQDPQLGIGNKTFLHVSLSSIYQLVNICASLRETIIGSSFKESHYEITGRASECWFGYCEFKSSHQGRQYKIFICIGCPLGWVKFPDW